MSSSNKLYFVNNKNYLYFLFSCYQSKFTWSIVFLSYLARNKKIEHILEFPKNPFSLYCLHAHGVVSFFIIPFTSSPFFNFSIKYFPFSSFLCLVALPLYFYISFSRDFLKNRPSLNKTCETIFLHFLYKFIDWYKTFQNEKLWLTT